MPLCAQVAGLLGPAARTDKKSPHVADVEVSFWIDVMYNGRKPFLLFLTSEA